MVNHRIIRIVVGCAAAALMSTVLLVAGFFAGQQEHVTTGTVLLVFAASLALLSTLSSRSAAMPQRWAGTLALALGLAGAGLVAFSPSERVIDALGWIWPPLLLAVVARTAVRVRRDLPGRARSWVVYPMLGVLAMSALGGGYETVSAAHDRRVFPAPGELIDIGGYRLHLLCRGSGSPTVILESGLGETGDYWGWISNAIAPETKVCTYDRAGRGWSDAAPGPQDGIAVARDLHVLLERAHVSGPFVLVGHSSGAQYVRTFAGRYPEQLAGMVLLDGQPAEVFERLPIFPTFYSIFRRVYPLLPSLARVGVARLMYHPATLPAPFGDRHRVSHSSPRLYRSTSDEFAELPAAMRQARACQSLGDRPLVVVTATVDAEVGWLPLQDELVTLSTNSSHRVVAHTHEQLITDPTAALVSTEAIRDVVRAVRSGVRLK